MVSSSIVLLFHDSPLPLFPLFTVRHSSVPSLRQFFLRKSNVKIKKNFFKNFLTPFHGGRASLICVIFQKKIKKSEILKVQKYQIQKKK